MKRTICTLLAAAIITSASAFDIKDALGKLKGNSSSSQSTEQSSDKKSSTVGAALGALNNVAGAILSRQDLSVSDLNGSWGYTSPAVTFKSDDLLKKAGGSVASSTIEPKLASIYKTLGFSSMELSVADDGAFTMQLSKVKLSGTVDVKKVEGSLANFAFAFKAGGKLKVLSMDAYVTKGIDGTLSLTFDASKLMDLLNLAAGAIKNDKLTSLNNLLQSYDGLCLGFKLKKQ